MDTKELSEFESHDSEIVNAALDKLNELKIPELKELLMIQIVKGVEFFNAVSEGTEYDISDQLKMITNFLGLDVKELVQKIVENKIDDVESERIKIDEDSTDEDVVNFILQNSQGVDDIKDKYDSYKKYISDILKSEA